MVIFPNCKINLGLHVVRKRPDGYHDLETVFYPIPFYDALEAVTIPGGGQTDRLHVTGFEVNGKAADNLCMRAIALVRQLFPTLPGLEVHLHKNIPLGAGLGGGSSDGAHMLLLLNQKFDLKLSEEQLLALALKLGSDAPFFIVNQPCFATGRGEWLTPLDLSLAGYWLLLMNPGIHIQTAWAFGQVQPQVPDHSLATLVCENIHAWKNRVRNDFESAIAATHPVVGKLTELAYENGAIFAAMTGSGSTCYGIFEKEPQIDRFTTAQNIWLKKCRL